MGKDTVVRLHQPEHGEDALSTMLRDGAQRLIAEALQAEFEEFLAQFVGRRDEFGRAAVVRNGFHPQREVLTGLGPVGVQVPKARSRTEEAAVFRSSLVPPYVRRSKSLDAALPWLYLHGISTGDMREALAALVGPEAKGLSAPVVARLKSRWSQEYQTWRRRKLGKDRWVYLWADGIYSGLRAEDERLCALVVIGVNERGKKQFLAIEDGMRESKTSWADVLRDLKRRGLIVAPKLGVGDGALGFWAALKEVFAETRQQKCWVHKTANVLNYLPRAVQPKAKAALHEIWMANGVRPVHCRLRREIPEGGRVLGQGSRRAAGVLRVPGRALGSHPYLERHRIDLRDGAAPNRSHEGITDSRWNAGDDLQARHERPGQLAQAARLPVARQSNRGRQVPRRNRGAEEEGSGNQPEKSAQQDRRLINFSNTRFDKSSLNPATVLTWCIRAPASCDRYRLRTLLVGVKGQCPVRTQFGEVDWREILSRLRAWGTQTPVKRLRRRPLAIGENTHHVRLEPWKLGAKGTQKLNQHVCR